MKRTVSFLLVIALVFSMLIFSVGCNEDGENEYATHTAEISYTHFNTASLLSTYQDISKEQFDSYIKVSDEMLGYYHKLFDIYFEYSGINNLKTVNKNAGIAPVTVDEELIVFLEYCKELYTLTQGKTNIMLGSVLKLWHEARETATENGGTLDGSLLPTETALAEAALHTSIDLLVIDREAKTVFITDPKASIDVGATGKGYAAKKLADKLKTLGADSTVLNAGGNIVTIGVKPSGGKWVTGIRNPDLSSSESLICRIEIGETSIVTSGDYERFFVSGDRKYHHVIDPVTLMPADHFSSVTILAEDSGLADALSTALFCMPYEEGLALINSIGNVDAVWVYKDGTLKSTDGVKIVK